MPALRCIAAVAVTCVLALSLRSADATSLRHRLTVNHRIAQSLDARVDASSFAPVKGMLEEGSPAHRILSHVESLKAQLQERLVKSQESCRLDQDILSKRADTATGDAEKAAAEVEKNRKCMKVNLEAKSNAAKEIGRLLKTLTPRTVYTELENRSASVERVMHKYTDVKLARDQKYVAEQKSRDQSSAIIDQILAILRDFYEKKEQLPPAVDQTPSAAAAAALVEVGQEAGRAQTAAAATVSRLVASIRAGDRATAMRLVHGATAAPKATVAGTIFRQIWSLQHKIGNESSVAEERHQLRADEHRSQIESLQADIDTIEGQIREHQVYDQDVRSQIEGLQGNIGNLTAALMKCKEEYNQHHGIQSSKMSHAASLEQQAEKNLELCKKEHKHIQDEIAIGSYVVEKINGTVQKLAAQIASGATGSSSTGAAGATGSAEQ